MHPFRVIAVPWRSCVCEVLSVRRIPGPFGCYPYAQCYFLEMRTCLWSCLGCIQAVPPDILTSQILKCPLPVFSFPRFSSFPTLKLFSWQFNNLWNTCHTSHQMAPSCGVAKWLSLPLWVSKSKGSIEYWKKCRTWQGGYAHNWENAQNLLSFSSRRLKKSRAGD